MRLKVKLHRAFPSLVFCSRLEQMELKAFSLKNSKGMEARVINLGGIITHLIVPKNGIRTDVVLGFERDEDYLDPHPYFGGLIGRYANRIANGSVEIDGVSYQLSMNEGPHTLHGGWIGLDKKIWNCQQITSDHLKLQIISPAGEEGFPGTLKVEVDYLLNDANALQLNYQATTDAPTPVNLTNHSYFNLNGKGTILDHELWINADVFTEVDAHLIPTGDLKPLNRDWSFKERRRIVHGGYDHNYVLRGEELRHVASLWGDQSKIRMDVLTTEPGLQFYTGNFLDGSLRGKRGDFYEAHHGMCLECQHFPDSPHHPLFPNTILRPGEVYRQTTIYRFS
jgi:aldose 1-epimerase